MEVSKDCYCSTLRGYQMMIAAGRTDSEVSSEQGKNLFNEIRTLYSKSLRAESHLTFFTERQRKGVPPVNLEYNCNFNVAFADNAITSKLKAIDKSKHNRRDLVVH